MLLCRAACLECGARAALIPEGLLGFFDFFRRRAADPRCRMRWPTSSTSNRLSWRRRASTSIPARAPVITPRCCSASRASRPPSSSRAGAPIRSGSPWWRNWSRACCDPMRPTGANQLDALQRAVAFDLRPLPGPAVARRAGLERAARGTGAPAADDRHARRPSGPSTSASPWAETYFDMMPIHEKLRGSEYPDHPQLSAGDALQYP